MTSRSFYPRVRVGRDLDCYQIPYEHRKVSIRASAWDATFRLLLVPVSPVCFYPRVRVGRDVFILSGL